MWTRRHLAAAIAICFSTAGTDAAPDADTANPVVFEEIVTLSAEGRTIRFPKPVPHRHRTSGLCLDLVPEWQLSGPRTAKLADGTEVSFRITCTTSLDERFDASSYLTWHKPDTAKEVCGIFKQIPLGDTVVKCEVWATSEVSAQKGTWREAGRK